MASAKASKRGKRDTLSIESFQYPNDLGLALPSLILGIEVDPKSFGSDYPPCGYRFKPGPQWINLVHTTQGHGCGQRYLIATVLNPTPAAALGMSRLAGEWLDSDVGCYGAPLVDVLTYRENLKLWLGADCNHTYRDFEEAFYPIDIEHLPKLTTDAIPAIPADPDDLIDWDSGMQRACGCVNRWGLWVLGENCD